MIGNLLKICRLVLLLHAAFLLGSRMIGNVAKEAIDRLEVQRCFLIRK